MVIEAGHPLFFPSPFFPRGPVLTLAMIMASRPSLLYTRCRKSKRLGGGRGEEPLRLWSPGEKTELRRFVVFGEMPTKLLQTARSSLRRGLIGSEGQPPAVQHSEEGRGFLATRGRDLQPAAVRASRCDPPFVLIALSRATGWLVSWAGLVLFLGLHPKTRGRQTRERACEAPVFLREHTAS